MSTTDPTLADEIRATIVQPPFAVSIGEAARICGLSLTAFRAQFLDTGLVQTIHVGKQSRIVDVQELRDAYRKYIAGKRRQ